MNKTDRRIFIVLAAITLALVGSTLILAGCFYMEPKPPSNGDRCETKCSTNNQDCMRWCDETPTY
jgi:hypothetical protein